MLCQFSFQNFKSYKGETTLDFQAATLPEFKETLITEEKAIDLLPVSVIYGPNGGGKSNLLQALSCVISTIVKPVHELEKNRQNLILQQKVDAVPFLFDQDSADEPTEFRMFFRIAKNEYCYYISLKNDEIISESLYRKRETDNITLGPSINKKSINTSVNPKMPYLSFLAINYDISVISEVMIWFESCIIRSYANPIVEHQIMLAKDAPYKEHFIRARKLIAALPVILIALREGRMVIIDELDAKLHPKLLKYVISLFKNKEINQYGAQLLFTSHDMYTLKNTVFRRDEIWFAAENNAHESEIYSLHATEQIHIYPICLEVNFNEPKTT